MFKKQEGITLVALVITIIVLLILAGVSISLVVGRNGVLTQASGAVEAQGDGAARQDVDMAVMAVNSAYWQQWTNNQTSTFLSYITADLINANLTEDGAAVTGTTSGFTYTSKAGHTYTFTVTEQGGITEWKKTK